MPYEYDERPEGHRPEANTSHGGRTRSGQRQRNTRNSRAFTGESSGKDQGWRARLAGAMSAGWNATTEWVGDTAEWAGEKVEDGVDWVQETAGGIADSTGDLIEGISNTKVSIGLEQAQATMRMEEIQEWLLPSHAAGGLNLSEDDKEKTVTATYEYATGMLTIETGSLGVNGAQIGMFRTGPAYLKDVVARLHNPDAGLPFFDDSWMQSASLELSIGSVTASDMHYGGEADGIGAESVLLQHMVIDVTDVGNAAPLTEGAGASTASFTVGSMALRGAYGDGTKVGSFNAEETQVSLDEATSSAEVNMGEVSATEISSRRNSSLSSAHFNGVKVGIGADASSLTAETGSINELVVGQKFALGSAESQGLSASLDHESGVITTSSDQLDISALRATDTTLDEASATMVQAELGPNPLQNLNMTSSLDTVTAKGLLVDDDFSATTMSGAGMTFGAKNGLLDIGAQSAAVENATTIHGTAGSASVDNLGVGVDIARGHTSVSADAVDLTAVDGNHASSGAIRTRGVTADIHNQARRFGLGVESVELDDLMTEHGSAESGTAAMLSVQHNDKDKASAVTANSVGLKGVTSDYGQAAQIDANAMSIDGQRKSGLFEGEVGFGSISGTQLSNDYGTVDTANLGGVSISSSMVDGLRTSSTSLDTTDFQGFQSEYGSISTGDAAGLNINTHGDALGITLDSMNASGLNSQYGSAATANMLGAEFSRTNGSTDSQLGFNSARLTTVESEYVSAEMMNAAGLNIAQHEEGTALSLDTAEAANLTGPYGTTLEHGRIDGVTAHHGPEATTAQLDRTQLNSLGINSNGVNAQIAHADLNGMQGTLRGHELDTSLDNGVISGAVGTFDNVEGLGIPNSGIPYVDMSRHELDARFGLDSGTVRLGAGNTAAIQDVAGMVDNANIQATVPMLPGDLEGMATIRPDTTLQAGLRIEDGRLVTDGTGVTSSQPIDGPAWTTINGAYLKETNQGGQLNASVGGFFDQNITGQMTEGLTGKKSKHIPLEVGALAQRLSEGKDTGAPSGHLTLGKENQGDNSVRVRSNANGLAAALTRLLVSSLRMKTSNGEIEAGRTAVTDAQLSTSGTANMPSTVTGSIGQVEVESLSAKHTLSGN